MDSSMQIFKGWPYAYQEVEHCWIRMTDGTRLSARLWLPESPKCEASPAVFEYIPYRKRDLHRARDEANHPFFAGHGYASVRVDMRGSGDSEGSITDMYTKAELNDAVEIIEWIADQPWCAGRGGMMGTSWGGTSSLQAASRRPESLKAVIAVCATNNRFEDDIHHMGGCLLTDSIQWGAHLPAILAAPPDPDVVGSNWRKLWLDRLEKITSPLENWIEHEHRDDYWRWGSVNETPDAIQCPVLAVGGWVDRYSNTVLNLLAKSHTRCWGIVGPWRHEYPHLSAPGPVIDFQGEALRFWDRWLKDIDNGFEDEPRVRVWLQSYDPPRDDQRQRSGHWIGESEWPCENVTPKVFYPSSGRLLAKACRDSESSQVPINLAVGLAAGDTGYMGRTGGLPLAQQEDDAFSLVFESEQLEAPLDLVGSAFLRADVDSDERVATLVLRLNDVPPQGDAARVTYAVRNLALDEAGTPTQSSNEPRRISIEFPNTAYRFAAGHKIRLAISSSYWPMI